VVTVREGWEDSTRPEGLRWFSVNVEELCEAVDKAEVMRQKFVDELLVRVG
jgi:hypothetical protein